jgi:hypothetical protein
MGAASSSKRNWLIIFPYAKSHKMRALLEEHAMRDSSTKQQQYSGSLYVKTMSWLLFIKISAKNSIKLKRVSRQINADPDSHCFISYSILGYIMLFPINRFRVRGYYKLIWNLPDSWVTNLAQIQKIHIKTEKFPIIYIKHPRASPLLWPSHRKVSNQAGRRIRHRSTPRHNQKESVEIPLGLWQFSSIIRNFKSTAST